MPPTTVERADTPQTNREDEGEVDAIAYEAPSIDLKCSRCGASQTYKLVPDNVLRTRD